MNGAANIALADQVERLAADLVDALNQPLPERERRCAALSGVLSALGAMAREAGLRGVPELLRLLQTGLAQLHSTHTALSDAEREVLPLWLVQVAGYCAGSLEADEYPSLLDTLAAMPWIPEVAPRMREFILGRLLESAPRGGGARVEPPLMIGEFDVEPPSELEPVGFESASAMAEPPLTIGEFGLEPASEPEPVGFEPAVAAEAGLRGLAWDSPPLAEVESEPPAFEAGVGPPEDPAFAPDAPRPGADIDDEVIWVTAEEFDLAGSAIADQLIPLTQQFFEAADTEPGRRLLADIEFHTGLVGQAFEVLGLPRLWEHTGQVQAMLQAAAAGEPGPTPEGLIAWQVALLSLLKRPDPSTAQLLCQMAAELIGDFDPTALLAELTRVQVGMDPRRVVERKRQATPEDVDLELAADVLPTVLEGMLRELPGNAARLGEGIRGFVAGGSAEDLAEARRFAHTLKGDANTVGLRGLANFTHALEDILLELSSESAPLPTELTQVLTESADLVEVIADYLLRRGPAPDDLLATYQRVLDLANVLFQNKFAAASPDVAAPAPAPPLEPRAVPGLTPGSAPAVRAMEASHAVAASLLNELLRMAGESIVLVRQVEQRVKDVGEVYRELVRQNSVNRDLVAQLDDLVALRGAALKSARLEGGREVDPLELDQYSELHVVSRRLIESNSDQIAFMQRMDGDLLTLDDLLSMQERTQGDLQRLVLRTRTIPLSSVTPRLQRVVRQVARQVLKSVELHIEGAATEIDSELLDRIVEPLSHILRNAVDHGIEAPEERKQADKPETGRIRLSVTLQGDAIEFVIADDGRGLDLDAVRRRALEMQVISADAAIGEAELTRLILLPGFSTKREATQVSGRGVGMDVVAQRVSDLRGNVVLRSNPGQGLEIRLRLPASLTSANVILARDGTHRVAAVASSVARIVALEVENVRIGPDGRLYADADGEVLPALPLSALFDAGNLGWSRPESRRTGLIVEGVGREPYLILAERVDEVRNVVVKNLRTYLAPIPALRGVTILGDGGIAPVLDLAQAVHEMARTGHVDRRALEPAAAAPRVARIVIADDSLSVRRALEQLLQDAGYGVVTARDGIEALDTIRSCAPIAALLDLEMPRLNGLDVTRFLRNNTETAHLPVIMITSRATEKYRVMAREAGVTHLMGKPFDEDELVLLVRQSIAAATDARSAFTP